jgi:hypothetical protein
VTDQQASLTASLLLQGEQKEFAATEKAYKPGSAQHPRESLGRSWGQNPGATNPDVANSFVLQQWP